MIDNYQQALTLMENMRLELGCGKSRKMAKFIVHNLYNELN